MRLSRARTCLSFRSCVGAPSLNFHEARHDSERLACDAFSSFSLIHLPCTETLWPRPHCCHIHTRTQTARAAPGCTARLDEMGARTCVGMAAAHGVDTVTENGRGSVKYRARDTDSRAAGGSGSGGAGGEMASWRMRPAAVGRRRRQWRGGSGAGRAATDRPEAASRERCAYVGHDRQTLRVKKYSRKGGARASCPVSACDPGRACPGATSPGFRFRLSLPAAERLASHTYI